MFAIREGVERSARRWFAALLLACATQAPAQTITVTLLGTGDPTPRLDRFGPSTLVAADGGYLLFDAGRGAMQRLYQLGVSTAELDAIFLTHLHSDHVVGLVDLWLTGWVINGRRDALRVYGPPGTQALVDHLREAFAFDIAIRIAESRRSPEGIRIEVVEIGPDYRWRQGAVEVQSFAVDHRPIEPAYGYRVDFKGRSVALSGDTRYSESLIRHSRGVDVLIHEVSEAPEAFKRAHPTLQRLAHHTQADAAGRVFAAVRPRLAVYSHLVLSAGFEAAELLPLTRRAYDGPLRVGEDLMQITIGERIRVGRAGVPAGAAASRGLRRGPRRNPAGR